MTNVKFDSFYSLLNNNNSKLYFPIWFTFLKERGEWKGRGSGVGVAT